MIRDLRQQPNDVAAALDRLAIRELIDGYSDAVNRVDGAAWIECWAQDARWIIRGKQIEGRESILQAWTRAMDQFENVFFTAFPGHLSVRGDEAEAVTHTLEYLKPKNAPAKLQSGIYRDKLKCLRGAWVFVERSFQPKELPL